MPFEKGGVHPIGLRYGGFSTSGVRIAMTVGEPYQAAFMVLYSTCRPGMDTSDRATRSGHGSASRSVYAGRMGLPTVTVEQISSIRSPQSLTSPR